MFHNCLHNTAWDAKTVIALRRSFVHVDYGGIPKVNIYSLMNVSAHCMGCSSHVNGQATTTSDYWCHYPQRCHVVVYRITINAFHFSPSIPAEMLGSVPWWVLYPGGGLLLLVATFFLLFSLYLAYIHRKYSHLPSPKMPRYGGLHAVNQTYYLRAVSHDVSVP